MKNIVRMLVNEDNVICLNFDSENEYASFVINDLFIEVQPYNDTLYMVTLTDDNTGDEYAVKYLTINTLHAMLKTL